MKLKNIFLALSLAVAATAVAQTESAYFIEGYNYRFRMNPAYGNEDSAFFSFPALGNLNVGVGSNIALSDILYNVNGRTTTFLNPEISAEEALKGIKDANNVNTDVNISLMTVGFKAFGGYNTVSLNARAAAGVKIPGSIFTLLKEGISNSTYNIGDFDAYGNAYGEISLGHSRNITKDLRVGANVKLLLGVLGFKADMRRADLTLGENDWTICTDADINVNSECVRYETEVSSETGNRYVSGADFDAGKLGICGTGFAVDLGAVYTPAFAPGLELSVAVNDLGAISWNNNYQATTGGEKTFNTDKYIFNINEDAPNSFENEFDRMKSDLAQLYELQDAGDTGGVSRGLGATMRIGAAYSLPVYRALTFGALYTQRFHGDFGWSDFRLSANVRPVKVIEIGANLWTGTFGTGVGAILNLHAPGFNFYIAADRYPGTFTQQYLPMNLNADVTMGINFNI